MFNFKPPNHDATPKPEGGYPLTAELEGASYVFDWLSLPEDEKTTDITDRLNFHAPLDFREARKEELARRLLNPNDDSGIITETELAQRVRKEVFVMAKLAVASTPDVYVCGKRASDYDCGTKTVNPDARKRKKSKTNAAFNRENISSGGELPRQQYWNSQQQSTNFMSHGEYVGMLPSQGLGGYHPDMPASYQMGSFNNNRPGRLNHNIASSMEQIRADEQRVLMTRYHLDQQLREWSMLNVGPTNAIERSQLTNQMMHNRMMSTQASQSLSPPLRNLGMSSMNNHHPASMSMHPHPISSSMHMNNGAHELHEMERRYMLSQSEIQQGPTVGEMNHLRPLATRGSGGDMQYGGGLSQYYPQQQHTPGMIQLLAMQSTNTPHTTSTNSVKGAGEGGGGTTSDSPK